MHETRLRPRTRYILCILIFLPILTFFAPATLHELEIIRASIDRVIESHRAHVSLVADAPPSRVRSFCECSYKSLIQLFVYVSIIYLKQVRATDQEDFDEDTAFQDRLDAAHACADIMQATMDEMASIAMGTGPGLKRPGIQHMCIMIGVS